MGNKKSFAFRLIAVLLTLCVAAGMLVSVSFAEGTVLGPVDPSSAQGAYVVPDGTTALSDYAFKDCTGLTAVTIPASVKTIGAGAFSGCSSLATITFKGNLDAVGINAFVDTPWYQNYPTDFVYASSPTGFNLLVGYKGDAENVEIPISTSAIGAGVEGRRTAMVYLVAEAAGCAVFGALFYGIGAFTTYPFMQNVMTSVSIALVNTLFRLFKVILLAPFIPLIHKAVCLLVQEKPEQEKPVPEAVRLEERFIEHPALAIEQSRLTINDMAQEARKNFVEAIALLHGFTDERYKAVAEMENSVDRYEDKLGTYLIKLTGRELTPRQNEDVSKFLHTISDFERISDHALNIAEAARELHEKSMAFSDEAAHELGVMESALCEILNNAVQAFVNNDLRKPSVLPVRTLAESAAGVGSAWIVRAIIPWVVMKEKFPDDDTRRDAPH